MNTFVILLRGINVGGNKKVPMADLKVLLESLGCTNVKTILNSGNAVFDSNERAAELKQKIEVGIAKKFGFEVATQIVDFLEIRKTLDAAPFKNVKFQDSLQFYVTFLGENSAGKKLVNESADFTIIAQTPQLLFTTVDSTQASTVDFMTVLDKNFGKHVTTRNWKTVEKIGACR